MKVAILGFGLEGKALLKFFKKSLPAGRQARDFKKADISVLDKKFNKNYLENLEQFDIIFRSPGIPYNLPEIQKAVKSGVKFSSATQLFFDVIRETMPKITPTIIGITGTKGKGTTSTLLYNILKACGKNAYLAGNIGKPAIGIIPRLSASTLINPRKSASIFIILELSSFQLQDLNYSPDIAVILDIFPDHLDSHKNFREYLNAKTNIAKWQSASRRKKNKIFYSADNKYSKWIAEKSQGKKIAVSTEKSSLFNPENLKIPGKHNIKNAVMAANIALSLDCPKEKIIKTIEKFKGNEHRLEFVQNIRVNPLLKNNNPRQSASIKFYNDSAGTNPQTAAAAIQAFKEPKILIAGGKDKNLNYSPLAKALKNSNTKSVILFGENKNKIAKAILKIKNNELEITETNSLKSAVKLAYKIAKSLVASSYTPNPIVIFSPASASFDMFENYEDRGKKFKEIVKKLK